MAMKDLFLKIVGRLLGLLGLTAIGTSCEEGMMMAEYGTPYTRFEVSGRLVDKETKEPVSGIVIVYGEERSHWDEYGNEDKEFRIGGSHVSAGSEFWMYGQMYTPRNPQQMMLKLSDYDSKENGHYKDTTYTIDLQRIGEPDEEDHWNEGIYGAEVTLELERVK